MESLLLFETWLKALLEWTLKVLDDLGVLVLGPGCGNECAGKIGVEVMRFQLLGVLAGESKLFEVVGVLVQFNSWEIGIRSNITLGYTLGVAKFESLTGVARLFVSDGEHASLLKSSSLQATSPTCLKYIVISKNNQ